MRVLNKWYEETYKMYCISHLKKKIVCFCSQGNETQKESTNVLELMKIFRDEQNEQNQKIEDSAINGELSGLELSDPEEGSENKPVKVKGSVLRNISMYRRN